MRLKKNKITEQYLKKYISNVPFDFHPNGQHNKYIAAWIQVPQFVNIGLGGRGEFCNFYYKIAIFKGAFKNTFLIEEITASIFGNLTRISSAIL